MVGGPREALVKSCPHRTLNRFVDQPTRPMNRGRPDGLPAGVVESLIKWLPDLSQLTQEKPKKDLLLCFIYITFAQPKKCSTT